MGGLEVLRSFPDEVRQDFGHQLNLLQQGEQPTNYRPVTSIGSGVFELRSEDERTWYRVIYLSRIHNVIHVLHCFEKRSREIPRNDFNLAQTRLKAVQVRIREERNMRSDLSKPAHVTRGDKNVFEDLGFSPEQAALLKFKSELYAAIMRHARRYSQKDLQIILNEPQPRVSELLNGKIANKTVDKLLEYAGRLGIEPKATFPQTHKEVVKRELAMAGR